MVMVWESNFDAATQWYQKGLAQYRRKHLSKALVCFDRALALVPNEADWWYWKGVTLRDLKRYEEALASFDRSLEITPDDPYSAKYRAHTLYSLERYEDAVVAYDSAMSVAPADNLTVLSHWKGRALYQLKRYEDALACFDRASELAPDESNQWYWKAGALFSLGRYEEGLVAYDRALALAPETGNAWYWKGQTLSHLKRDDEAFACFDRVLELAPSDSQAASARAGALFRLQRNDEALAAYDRALELAPADSHAQLNYWRGETLHRLNRYEEALAAYDEALALEDSHANWWCNRARACCALGRNDEARANAERAVTLDEQSSDGWYLKGEALYKLGSYQEALAAFECALRLVPQDGQAWEFKGASLFCLGRFEEAASAYDEALRLNPEAPDLRQRYTITMASIRRTTTDHRLKLRDGRWLGYLDYGDPDGAPIICCHGAPGSRLDFLNDERTLQELRIRLIVPDRPGYGLSDFQPHRRLLDWPADVEQLADYLGLGRFAMLGVSAGGPHAAACAYVIPHRLTRIGLVSSAAPPEFMPPIHTLPPRERPADIVTRYMPWLLQRALYVIPVLLIRRNPRKWVEEATARASVATDKAPGSPEITSDASTPLPPVMREVILEPFRQGVRGCAWDVRICAHRWKFLPADIRGAEVNLWHGERDPLVPISAARAFAAGIPQCHATFYPGETHDLSGHIREILATLAAPVHEQGKQERTDA